jgi:hypothetical protein
MKNEMGGACGMYEGEEKCRALVGKHKGKQPLRRPRNRWMILKRIFKKCVVGMD